MANKQFTGYLRDPLGEYAGNDKIRVTHLSTTGEVIAGSSSIFKVDETGFYDITIEYGNVVIESFDATRRSWYNHGVTVVNSETTATTLPSLLNALVPASDAVLLQMQTLLQNAENFAEDAKTSASEAAASAATIDEELIKYDATSMAIVQLSGGKLEFIKDALGNAHLFGVWAIQAYEQLGIPGCPFTGPIDVFRKSDGTYRSECRIAIHKSVNVGGRTVSRAGLAPYVYLNFDEFKAKANDLAGGFVMLDQYHDAFIGWQILSILANGGQKPRGNTEWGRAHDAIREVGRRVDGTISNERTGNGATLTGSGPDSWRHDGTPFGVSDWIGGVWELVDGFKMLGGQFYVAEYSGQPEAQWIATGRYINSGHIFSMTPPPSPVSGNQTWGLLTKSADYAGHELLQRLLIEPIDCTKVLNGRFYYNTDGERFPIRRGGWSDGGIAGPAALNLFHPRSTRNSSFGGRLAFVS